MYAGVRLADDECNASVWTGLDSDHRSAQFGENCSVQFKKLQPPIPGELTRTEPWNNTYLKQYLNFFSIYLIRKIYKEK